MPRRISVEERIKRLEENREYFIKQRVKSFEKRTRALYQARVDLLREKGLKPREKVKGNLEMMMEKARERYVFFRTRFYEYMGLSPAEAKAKAEVEYDRYRRRWLEAIRA